MENNSIKERITGFLSELSASPNEKAIRKHDQLKINYLPIGYVEDQLDRFFYGMWSFSIQEYSIELNSAVVHGRLMLVFPGGTEVIRDGIGAVPIEGYKMTNESIRAMALQKALPSARSFALSNAVQSLGNVFGRSMNRKDWFEIGFKESDKVGKLTYGGEDVTPKTE